MNKKYWMTGMLALLLVFSAGCGEKPAAAPSETEPSQETAAMLPEEPQEQPETPNDTNEPSEQNSPDTSATNVNSGAGGDNSPETGSEDVTSTPADSNKANITLYYTDPEMLGVKQSSREITYTDEQDKYKKTFEALQQSDDADLKPLWSEAITLRSIGLDGGELTIDISKPAEANLGAGGEMYALDALRQTFFQFEEVQAIELLLEGEKVESLMGHVELEHPMNRNP
ncbi:GerMN domain-containing protein [Paenibacillus cisolokensis]|uniref:GerMN domain-containing protein n=1 Tax=Paenibacillus cisolokensis TaxID=1658519 RepID=UPI003D2759A7